MSSSDERDHLERAVLGELRIQDVLVVPDGQLSELCRVDEGLEHLGEAHVGVEGVLEVLDGGVGEVVVAGDPPEHGGVEGAAVLPRLQAVGRL